MYPSTYVYFVVNDIYRGFGDISKNQEFLLRFNVQIGMTTAAEGWDDSRDQRHKPNGPREKQVVRTFRYNRRHAMGELWRM